MYYNCTNNISRIHFLLFAENERRFLDNDNLGGEVLYQSHNILKFIDSVMKLPRRSTATTDQQMRDIRRRTKFDSEASM